VKEIGEFLMGRQSRQSLRIIGTSACAGIVCDTFHVKTGACIFVMLLCTGIGVLLSSNVLFGDNA
jgi:hypothetical protein